MFGGKVWADPSWEALVRPGRASDFFQFGQGIAGVVPAFDPSAGRYDIVNAWLLSEICRLVYKRNLDEYPATEDPLTRDDYLKRVGFREAGFVNTGQIQAMVVTHRDPAERPFAILVFRGSNNFSNWLSNLNTFQVAWPEGGQVHWGFKNAFNEVWPAVSEMVGSLDPPWFYAGHSLGGALALMAASRIPPVSVHTYGTPKVGDGGFVQTLNAVPVFRIVNNQDLVADLPPSRIPFEFLHVGQRFHLSDETTGCRAMLPVADSFRHPAPDNPDLPHPSPVFAMPEFLADHAPLNYSRRLIRMWRQRAAAGAPTDISSIPASPAPPSGFRPAF